MLDPKELKVVVSTLTKRRAWLKKALEDKSLEPNARTENLETLRLLESAIQKLSSNATRASQSTRTDSTGRAKPMDKATVLVAEDQESSAEMLITMLSDMGIKYIDLAKDGIEAFDRIKRAEQPYDVILCDWEMPLLSGIEVHGKAKASNTLQGAHFIMVTANSEAAHIKKAVQQGVNDYIVKPIDVDKLEEKIRAALGH